ncbi:YoaK family protein [Yimella sp. cx-51]|uniref:YoaK family protein n=1 Tax=Yimella sp. cx-51 TaxID=2770551 RepID=UPI0021083EEF|nr:YoaK family protein [Yimella sp. cx-51]
MLILLFGLLADRLVWAHRNLVFVAILCLTMGLQNALITKVSDAQIRTTHVTGMVTDIGIELGKFSYLHRSHDRDPVVADRSKLGILALLVGLFFVGGVVGALGYPAYGFLTLVPPALLLLLVGLPPVLADLRAQSAR